MPSLGEKRNTESRDVQTSSATDARGAFRHRMHERDTVDWDFRDILPDVFHYGFNKSAHTHLKRGLLLTRVLKVCNQ